MIVKILLPAVLAGVIWLNTVGAETQTHYQGMDVDSLAQLKALMSSVEQVEDGPMLRTLPPDYAEVTDVDEKKQLFISVLTPIVLAENRRIAEQRALLKLMLSRQGDGERELGDSPADQWLLKLLKRYRVPHQNVLNEDVGRLLLRRMDVVPPSLVLAQAAIESGWGTSRFALEGNSLFGQWTWAEGKSMTPSDRAEGATHGVRKFVSLRASVRSYLLNLNTNRAYRELRGLREQQREQGEPLDAYQLAAGLSRYSQRGDEYVRDVRAMIRSDELQMINLQLAQR
ncbi:MAG: glucosaminidase domain-containing protein [Gammaproteobacteria bacterium]|nr:glucosaminidase domain-containing protein [Gammaproteobacteria bacterium]